MRHSWFQRQWWQTCQACGDPDCVGRVAIEFCPSWQEAEARADRGEYLKTVPL